MKAIEPRRRTGASTLPRRSFLALVPAMFGAHGARAAAPREVRVVLHGREPVGGVQVVRLAKGDAVAITIDSDTPEDIHLHGYDLHAHPAPGRPAQLRFDAARTGRFTMELHGIERTVCVLEIYPK